MSAIQQDAESTPTNTTLTAETASELFLKQWKVAPDEPAKPVEGDKKPPAPVDAENASDDEELLLEDDEGSEDPKDSDKKALERQFIDNDDAVVKVAVNGQELEVSVKDLKRLYGQEQSLTHKSMELANRRKEAEEVGSYYASGLARLVQMAEEEYAPYANIDFLSAAKDPNISAEELRALREEAQTKYQKYQFLTQELGNYTKQQNEQRAQLMHQQASATIQELTHPETGIPNWGPQLYEEVGNYAVSKGMKPEAFAAILDAASLRVIHEAYRYDKAKKVATQKKASAPKSVLKSTATPDTARFDTDKSKASLSKLRQSGRREDAVSALLAKWGVE